MINNRWITVLAALGIWIGGSALANACGGAFMHALLFHKHPEAKEVSDAVSSARAQKTIGGESWNRSIGKSLHAWRAEKVEATITALEERFIAGEGEIKGLEDLHVFLIHEFAWLRFSLDENGTNITRTSADPGEGGVRVFTTRRVLDNVLDGSIGWQQAWDDGLFASKCAETCAQDSVELLAAVMTDQSIGDRALLEEVPR